MYSFVKQNSILQLLNVQTYNLKSTFFQLVTGVSNPNLLIFNAVKLDSSWKTSRINEIENLTKTKLYISESFEIIKSAVPSEMLNYFDSFSQLLISFKIYIHKYLAYVNFPELNPEDLGSQCP